MATKVILPKQGLQMTEGTILKWLVKEGEKCTEGEPLFEMETDKLTITIDAMASGTLLKIVRDEGETVPITELIAVIGDTNEDISSLLQQAEVAENSASVGDIEKPQEEAAPVVSEARRTGERVFITPRAKMVAAQNNTDYSAIAGSGPDGLIIERDVAQAQGVSPKATPLARKVAQDGGVSLRDLQGTGERGKIIRADVARSLEDSTKAAQGQGRLVPFTGMRKVIADRMKQSLQTNAQTTHTVCVDMSEAVRLRESLKAAGRKVSFNDIISLCVCKALLEFPMVNAELTAEGILEKDYVNLGIAVAIDKGLIVPVIKNAHAMTLSGLSEATKELSGKAKEGKLRPDEYSGGSFTISNLGMFGLSNFVAIINPPESAILAVSMIEKRAVVVDDEIVIRPMMNLTLSYDHRVIDGAPAAQFIGRVKQFLENTYLIL